MLPKDLYLVRVGQHEASTAVFDVNGVLDGPRPSAVAYVDGEVTADASGLRVPTDGSARSRSASARQRWGTAHRATSPVACSQGWR